MRIAAQAIVGADAGSAAASGRSTARVGSASTRVAAACLGTPLAAALALPILVAATFASILPLLVAVPVAVAAFPASLSAEELVLDELELEVEVEAVVVAAAVAANEPVSGSPKPGTTTVSN